MFCCTVEDDGITTIDQSWLIIILEEYMMETWIIKSSSSRTEISLDSEVGSILKAQFM